MTQAIEKSAAISRLVETARQAGAHGIDRHGLEPILAALIEVAAHKQWWSEDAYPAPVGAERQARYLIHEDVDGANALYLNVMKPGKLAHPHNHTTWACIAAVEGAERNSLYTRTDDGSRPGFATLSLTHEKLVSPGGGIALLPDDIHSVEIEGGDSIRHLHMYGIALEKLTERLVFDTANNRYSLKSIGVQSRRSAAA